MDNAIKSVKPLGFPWQTQDPFLFCVHHEDHYPRGNEKMGPDASLSGRSIGQDFAMNKDGWRMYHGKQVPGFPAHPHRGFETVTVVTKGIVDHSDSLGAAGRFGFGDVQWMTAGKGVQHCEMFPLLHKDRDNPLELFQIWLNLPSSKKLEAPYFSMLWKESIPTVKVTDNKGSSAYVKIIAGNFEGTDAPDPAPGSWAANPVNEVAIWTIKLEPGVKFKLPPASKDINRSLFYYKGSSLALDGKTLTSQQTIELYGDRGVELSNGDLESHLLLLQGRPIGEPVVKYGPFVMNSQQEIEQAMKEYKNTQFGGWPWPTYEHVHPREKTRFALYPDGREEVKEIN